MKNIFNLIIGIFIGLIVAGLLYLTGRTPAGEPVQLLPTPSPEPIVVYVSGAVKRPGVYRLPPESRLVDAVQQAGGFLSDVDISKLNLAKVVVDGDQIDIPGGKDIATPVLTIGGSGLLFTPTPPSGQLININLASADELDSKLPGIGPTAAKQIVDHRPYISINDLQNVPGIGPTIFNEIKGLVTVGP